MSSIDRVQSLYSVSGNSFEERRHKIVDSKIAAAEAVNEGADVNKVADKLGLSPAFVQHYANKLKELGGSDFRKNIEKEEETHEKGLQGFLKQLLDEFKKAISGN